mgnify:FL=1
MKTSIQLLDCTLRDGGYLVDTMFGETFVKGFTRSMTDAGLNVVEVGFLKDEPHRTGSTIYNNAAQIRPYLPRQRREGVSYVCLSDYSRYHISNLEPYDGTSIDGVRACFFKKERKDVLDFCREIKRKGYKLYVQPVDILGYSDEELLDLIADVNEIGPYAFSTVDTFGSMYPEDLPRVFRLINEHLAPGVRMGFHSHNNLQMSFALSQEFARLANGVRDITIDATLCGMGRGAGNTNTELVASYLNSHWGAHYDLDVLLDAVDNYMGSMRSRCTWGYSVPYFLAGIYSAHVHNITYLSDKPSVRAKDMRFVLEQLPADVRKRYDYDLVDKLYASRLASTGDDSTSRNVFAKKVEGRSVLLVMPGPTSRTYADKVAAWKQAHNALTITVNQLPAEGEPLPDLCFFSNPKRYDYWKHDPRFAQVDKVLTSNLCESEGEGQWVVNIAPLLRPGFKYADNAALLLLTLLDGCRPAAVGLAGLDGYDVDKKNFTTQDMERRFEAQQAAEINQGIAGALADLAAHRKGMLPVFVTPSRFEDALK